MFKAGCLYSVHALFSEMYVVHRAAIKLELAFNLKSHFQRWLRDCSQVGFIVFLCT